MSAKKSHIWGRTFVLLLSTMGKKVVVWDERLEKRDLPWKVQEKNEGSNEATISHGQFFSLRFFLSYLVVVSNSFKSQLSFHWFVTTPGIFESHKLWKPWIPLSVSVLTWVFCFFIIFLVLVFGFPFFGWWLQKKKQEVKERRNAICKFFL